MLLAPHDVDPNPECDCWPDIYRVLVDCADKICRPLAVTERIEFGHEVFLAKIWHPAERRWRLHPVLHPMSEDEKRAYLYVVVSNMWKNRWRAKKTQPHFVGDTALVYHPADAETPNPVEARAILHEETQRLDWALAQLEPWEHTVFIMAEIDGCPLKEIATHLGLSRTRVWQIRRDIKRKINTLLYPLESF